MYIPPYVQQPRIQNHVALIHRIYDSDSEFWQADIRRNPRTVESFSTASLWGRVNTDRARRAGLFRHLVEATYVAKRVPPGWDGYSAPAPNQNSVINAVKLLARMLFESTLTPYSVLPSADGGVGVSFRGRENTRALLEFFNDGTTTYTLYGKGHPTEAADFNPGDHAVLDRLKEYL